MCWLSEAHAGHRHSRDTQAGSSTLYLSSHPLRVLQIFLSVSTQPELFMVPSYLILLVKCDCGLDLCLFRCWQQSWTAMSSQSHWLVIKSFLPHFRFFLKSNKLKLIFLIIQFIQTIFLLFLTRIKGFPEGASGKESACQCRRHKRHRSSPWGKTLWRRKCQPLQGLCPGHSMHRRAWWATDHGVTESVTERLSAL